MKGTEEYLGQIASCTDCDLCTGVCAFSVVGEKELYSPKHKIAQLEKIANGEELSQDEYDTVYLCTRCGVCNDVCPVDIDLAGIIQHERGLLTRQGREPEKTAHIANNILTSYNPKGEKNEHRNDLWITEDLKLDPESKIAYMAGCWIAFKNVDIARDTVRILNACGITPRAIEEERCCGLFLVDNGYLDEMKEYAKSFTDYLESLGIEKIITSCPGCYIILGKAYESLYRKPSYEVVHAMDVFEQLYDDGKMKIKKQHGIVSLKDACPMKDMFDVPRKLLGAMGKDVQEIKGETTFCCGAPAGAKPNYPELSGKIGKVSLDRSSNTDTMVTYCSFCKHHFDGIKDAEGITSPEVKDIASVLWECLDKT